MNSKHDYIAVFDSGVGGISVLRHLVRQLPGERFLYFGDSANAPYGTRPAHQIRELTLAAAEHLIDRGIKALVVACNTATSVAIDDLRQKYPDLIVIGIEPALKLAAQHFPGGRIGVMATPVTLQEGKFARLLEHYASCCTITKLPAPGLVELVESGQVHSEATLELLAPLLSPHAGQLDAVVLGCTHYPFAAAEISQILGVNTALLDGGEGTARETRRRLEAAGLLEEGCGCVTLENSSQDPTLLALAQALLERQEEDHA
jgi:glutamate racemase